MSLSRCMAPADDLDGGRYPPRSKEHTELISAEFELGELWNKYGLVGDVVVTIYSSFLLLSTTFLLLHIFQPFTNDFPWADIHELLSPDLLHQLIKGAFKDHLVMWIVDYIECNNSDARVKQILDDIDHR